MKKIIVPNQFESKDGIRTPQRIFQILALFGNIPGRKIVFSKNIPRGSIVTRSTLPQGHTYFDFEEREDVIKLPVVHWVGLGMLGERIGAWLFRRSAVRAFSASQETTK